MHFNLEVTRCVTECDMTVLCWRQVSETGTLREIRDYTSIGRHQASNRFIQYFYQCKHIGLYIGADFTLHRDSEKNDPVPVVQPGQKYGTILSWLQLKSSIAE